MDKKVKQTRKKKCQGGLPNCKNYIGDYKDVEGVGCCEQCDKYVDDNPYDPYWEQMEQLFEDSKECIKPICTSLLEEFNNPSNSCINFSSMNYNQFIL